MTINNDYSQLLMLSCVAHLPMWRQCAYK